SDYSIALKEIRTRPVPLLTATSERTDQGWQIVPRVEQSLAWKDMSEGPKRESPVQLTRVPGGGVIDSIAVSPDGSQLLFTVLMPAKSPGEFRSQMQIIRTDGSGGADLLSDGKSLDLT